MTDTLPATVATHLEFCTGQVPHSLCTVYVMVNAFVREVLRHHLLHGYR